MNQNLDPPSPDNPAARAGDGGARRDHRGESPDETGGEPSPRPAADPPGRCLVELNLLADETDPPLAGWLDAQLVRIAAIERVTDGCLSVAVVDDAQMARLQRRYKQTGGTTDVLAFDLRDGQDDPIDADLVICRDEAARQAAARGHAVRLELLLYAVHGLLHLLGYGDDDPDRAEVMHHREDALLTAVGLDAAYYGRSPSC